ncbi:hypothetical protein Cgig2_003232 [Carnegiea gigantea]|uniref:Endonuclease/exonuclease/phosphatase domain-containing protein n=1 Tax=Carnegiea gigantea TaxID=171969 RepID=A0A9Q1JTJ5_9CARY|nr:hypothetical protein Cgig2_003232 [Carnegiea gigantea]
MVVDAEMELVLGVTRAISDLRGLLRRLAPKVVFLLETKRSKVEMESILPKLAKWEGDDTAWRFSGIYGWPETHFKWRTGQLIFDLKSHSDLPWLIGGDLNKICYHGEKLGGPHKSQTAIDNFREAFLDNDLHDMGFSGYEYTWCNYQKDRNDLIAFCADTDWTIIFPNACVTHVDFDMSDHIPILLKCRPSTGGKISEQSCADVVSAAWSSTSHADAMENLMG